MKILNSCLISLAFSLFLTPQVTQAGLFSVFSDLLASTDSTLVANASSDNSQNIPILKANSSPILAGKMATQTQVSPIEEGSAILAESGPLGTSQDITEGSVSHQISLYTVRSSDTLSSIAKMYGVSVNTIIWANDLGSGSISEGQTLVILPISGVLYTVKKGDTVESIAKKYKADTKEIVELNDLVGGSSKVGDTLTIPDVEGTKTAPAPAANTPAAKMQALYATLKKNSNARTAPLRGANGPEYGDYYSFPVEGGVITQSLHGYNAIDIGAPKGTPIYAAAAGDVIVARSGGWNGGYGSYVVISHPNGSQTVYGHMSKVFASVGDRVYRGELIGYVGATGEATGPHTHFEVRGAKNPFGDLPVGTRE